MCVAAVMTVVFQRLHQPVVLGYLLAGLVVGPHLPVPLVADADIVKTLSELGVILLMFSLGLELSVRKLVRVGPAAGLAAVIETSLMLWLGFMTGRLLGWSTIESLFAGGVVAISSTTIIARTFAERQVRGRLRDLVVGVLVFEDLIAILLMATLTAVASGAGLSAEALFSTTARLIGFLIAFVAIGLLVVPRAIRAVVSLKRPETTLVASVGLCFGGALLAQAAGYSVALGAFVTGALVAESGEAEQIEPLVHPVRDVFAAIFFVSVGMLIDPAVIARQWPTVVALAAVVMGGKIIAVSLGAFLAGNGTRDSVAAGMSMAQIGEFSFIIAALGLTIGATGADLYPVAVAVSALTTLTTPWMVRASEPVAKLIDRKLPRPLQTFASLYGSWLERMRAQRQQEQRTQGAAIRRLVGILVIDAALLGAVVIGASLSVRTWPAFRWFLIAGGAFLAALFCLGMLRVARRLGMLLAELALPEVFAAAPRRALAVTLQLATLLLTGLPLVAVTQPFLAGFPVVVVLLVPIVALVWAIWRRAADLHGHVRAGAGMIVEALAAQSAATEPGHELDQVHEILPGIGEPIPVKLADRSPAVGKSLAQLDLRGVTGATVLAIRREGGDVVVPTAREVLRAGDVLALAGSHEAIDAARALLSA
jgi:CPA2 family monovalent cation:H+ antiporter-2